MPKAKRQSSKSVNVVITSSAGDLTQKVSALKKHGLEVDSVLDKIGVITGRISSDKVAKIKSIPGITVEPDESVQLPPPDAPVQ